MPINAPNVQQIDSAASRQAPQPTKKRYDSASSPKPISPRWRRRRFVCMALNQSPGVSLLACCGSLPEHSVTRAVLA